MPKKRSANVNGAKINEYLYADGIIYETPNGKKLHINVLTTKQQIFNKNAFNF